MRKKSAGDLEEFDVKVKFFSISTDRKLTRLELEELKRVITEAIKNRYLFEEFVISVGDEYDPRWPDMEASPPHSRLCFISSDPAKIKLQFGQGRLRAIVKEYRRKE